MVGAAVGTLLDGIHVYGDVLSYPHAAFGRWAWFVPVEFGVIALLMGVFMPALERRLTRDTIQSFTPPQAAADVLLFAALYFCTVLADGHGIWPALVAVALALLAIGRVVWGGRRGDWFYALAAAIAGPIGESLMIELGLFDYAHPDLAHVPLWLGPLWANGGLMIRRAVGAIVLPTTGQRTSLKTPMPPGGRRQLPE